MSNNHIVAVEIKGESYLGCWTEQFTESDKLFGDSLVTEPNDVADCLAHALSLIHI